jgi:hypothetical protein
MLIDLIDITGFRGNTGSAMDEHVDNEHRASERPRLRPLRLPSQRASAALATLMLGVGILAGAAIGPAPEMSFAGNSTEIARRLLLTSLLARPHGTPVARQSTTPARAPEEAPAPATAASGPRASATETPAAKEETGGSEETGSKETPKAKSKLPPIASVWLIELSGAGFQAALAQPAAAPFISQTVPEGALLNGWSALSASALASEAALAVPPAEGAAPPLLHTIVQPPCPEGVAGQACAPETPGELTAADAFLKATLATITGTPAYQEHGLVVITFATVGQPTQAGLPEGASSATLTYQPPAGALLLSPFVTAGSKPSLAFDSTSPQKSLEKLLHK